MAVGRFVVASGDDTQTVEVGASGDVTIGDADRTVAVRAIDGCEYETTRGLRRSKVFVVGNGSAREVFLNGRVYRFEVSSADERRKAAGAGHGDQPTAPMPGTIVKMLVEIGQHVERGQVLLKLEAMKMEMPIRATHDGTVAVIHCREGELVQGGAPLVEIARAEG